MNIRIKKLISVFITMLMIVSWQIPVYAAGSDLITVNIPVSQITGNKSDETYNYILFPNDPSNPMPDTAGPNGYSFSITGNNTADIPITFYHGGIYTYTLIRDGIVPDNTVCLQNMYEITASVKNEQNGNLSYSLTVADNFEKKEEKICYEYETVSDVHDNVQNLTHTENKPDTSDAFDCYIWIFILCAAMISIVVFTFSFRKKD